jgi:serine/threonine protein phosphatase 1
VYKQIINSKDYHFHYDITSIPKGRVLVIADIHGCIKSLNALLEKIELTKDDTLFLLGDMINKGPCSLEVLDRIVELIYDGYNILPLKGNHESFIIEDLDENNQIIFRPGNEPLTEGQGKYTLNEYSLFFRQLPYYYKIENTIMVHAGLNFEADNPLTDYESMMWIREFEPDNIPDFRIIHGHNSSILKRIKSSVENDEMIINLDNGCYKTHKIFMGNLLCLNLTTMTLFEQPNIES